MQEHPRVEKLSMVYTCRTCLNTDSSLHLISIFEDHESSGKCAFNLLDQLMLLGLKIHRDDGFPVNICSHCVERLATIVAFRTQCEKSRELLEIYFTELPQEQPECNTREDSEYVDIEFLVVATPHELQDVNQQQAIQCHDEPVKKEYNLDSSLRDEVHLEQHPPNHEDVKNVEVSYSCMKCGKRFLKAESLSQHENHGKCVSPENPTCRFCHETFPSMTHLEKHIDNDHPPDRPHSCPECQKTFQSVSNRNTHLQLHTEPVQCGLCEQMFRSKRYLAKHTKTVHTVTNHHCEQCGTIFTSTSKYEYHLKTHETDKKYKCSSCSKSFLQQHHLLNHERTHTGQRPFLCNVCGKSFTHEPSFKTHLRTHEGVRPHTCEICDKTFVLRSTYLQHMDKHRNARCFQCEKCGKNFIQRSAFEQHLKTHNQQISHNTSDRIAELSLGDAPTELKSKSVSYGCDLCNKTFRLPSSLTSHMRIHKEERKHECDQCGNTFKRAEHLRVHINGVHLKRKPYSCEICNKSFAQSGDRNAHMRTHMAEKPHRCSYCGKGFSLAKALRAHVRLHTGERPFVCIICNMSFISYTALASHTQKHQEEEQIEITKTDNSVSEILM